MPPITSKNKITDKLKKMSTKPPQDSMIINRQRMEVKKGPKDSMILNRKRMDSDHQSLSEPTSTFEKNASSSKSKSKALQTG